MQVWNIGFIIIITQGSSNTVPTLDLYSKQGNFFLFLNFFLTLRLLFIIIVKTLYIILLINSLFSKWVISENSLYVFVSHR